MYQPKPTKAQISRARSLRQVDNTAEGQLWLRLRNRQFHDLKFVRQFPIGPYFADLACRDRKLVIEIDGSQHIGSAHDETRNAFMINEGWSVARFWYADVLNDTDTVLETLAAIVEDRITERVDSREFQFYPASPLPGASRHPLPQGRGEDIATLSLKGEGRGEGGARDADVRFMTRALELGLAQLGRTQPNPAVGCVIVKDGVILAERATGDGGRPHAEEAALATLNGRAEGATAYVTLEPCAERSSGACSCSQRLVEARVGRVVFACEDPSPYASHIGTRRLRDAGIEVETGLMAEDCAVLIADFVNNLPVR